jgi:hypothetical protein
VSTTAHTTSGDTNYGVPATLTNTPTRGYLTYVGVNDRHYTEAGWFHLTGNGGIARRRIGGRNTSLRTTQGRLIEFVADPKAK